MKEFNETLIVEKAGRFYISGEWAFYFFSVYGIPPEVFQEEVSKYIYEKVIHRNINPVS